MLPTLITSCKLDHAHMIYLSFAVVGKWQHQLLACSVSSRAVSAALYPQIENRLLLERFQRAAEARDPLKVKGLFCHVPDESLEHTVLYGMGGAASMKGDCAGSCSSHAASPPKADACRSLHDWNGDAIDSFLGECFTTANRGFSHSGSGSGENRDRTTTDDSHAGARPDGYARKPLEFPRAFSRHSTLEEERKYANTNRGRRWEGHGVRHRRSGSSPAVEGSGPDDTLSSLPEDSGSPLGQGRPWRHRSAGESFAAGGQLDPAVSGLRFLALCRVMIGSMHVASAADRTPSAPAERTDAGRCVTGSLPSRDSSSSQSSTKAAALAQQQHAPPCSPAVSPRDQFSLPPPPPGHADFDAVYFPLQEEYRLLNEDFVLPEFLVVHRFVAAAPSSGSARVRGNGPGPYCSPPSAGSVTAIDAVSIAADSGRGGSAKAQTEKWVVGGGRAHEREPQRQQRHGRYGRPSGDVSQAREPSSASDGSPGQDATSVVAGIEAAIESVTSPHLLPLATLGSGDSKRFMRWAAAFSWTSNGHGGSDPCVSLECDGVNGRRVGSLPFDPIGGRGDAGVMNGSDDGCPRKGRLRGSGPASRDAIVRDVKSECACRGVNASWRVSPAAVMVALAAANRGTDLKAGELVSNSSYISSFPTAQTPDMIAWTPRNSKTPTVSACGSCSSSTPVFQRVIDLQPLSLPVSFVFCARDLKLNAFGRRSFGCGTWRGTKSRDQRYRGGS